MMTRAKLIEALWLAFQLRSAGVPEEQIPIYSIREMREMLWQLQQNRLNLRPEEKGLEPSGDDSGDDSDLFH